MGWGGNNLSNRMYPYIHRTICFGEVVQPTFRCGLNLLGVMRTFLLGGRVCFWKSSGNDTLKYHFLQPSTLDPLFLVANPELTVPKSFPREGESYQLR